MAQDDWLADRFEEHRSHLRAVAYRMLGSLSDADDAVQEAWIRLSRSDSSAVENLGGWLTTVVARVALDMLRSRNSRREEPVGEVPASHAFTANAVASRPRYAYFPFGAGPRACIGNHFALMEAALVLAAVVQRFVVRVEAGHPVELEPQISLRLKGGTFVTLQSRRG